MLGSVFFNHIICRSCFGLLLITLMKSRIGQLYWIEKQKWGLFCIGIRGKKYWIRTTRDKMHVLSEWTTRKNLNYNQEFPCFLGQARKKMDNPSKTRTGGSTKCSLCELAGCLAVASAELRAQTASPPWPDRGKGSALRPLNLNLTSARLWILIFKGCERLFKNKRRFGEVS